MILMTFYRGVAVCRDEYQWTAANAKERSLEGQARALQLAKLHVSRQVERDGFQHAIMYLETPMFRDEPPLYGFCLAPFTVPCMECGKRTLTFCSRCDYPYCKETCLRAHIEKSKSCKCRMQHKDCNPLQRQRNVQETAWTQGRRPASVFLLWMPRTSGRGQVDFMSWMLGSSLLQPQVSSQALE